MELIRQARMADDLILVKPRCGALFPRAQVNRALNAYENISTFGAWSAEISVIRKLFGGLWVGGDLYVSRDATIFRPNELNRLVHEGDVSLTIPFSGISDITCRFGLVTKIVDICNGNARHSIRCYGAEILTDTLNQCLLDWRSNGDATKALPANGR